jgi:catalase
MINRGKVSYGPNTLAGNDPKQASAGSEHGFSSYGQHFNTQKLRARSEKFFDHFSQATLFYRSQSGPEKNHLIKALCFELGKVDVLAVRERMVNLLTNVDQELATYVASALGATLTSEGLLNLGVPADADPKSYQPRTPMKKSQTQTVDFSSALSMANTSKNSIATRKIAILATDGVNEIFLRTMKRGLEAEGAVARVIATKLGIIR